MIKKIAITICAASLLLIACRTQKNAVAVYEFPPQMSTTVRDAYIKLCDKGKILYDLNCAKCHTTVVKRKTIIPDFTPEQLKGYEIRVSNPKHEMSLLEEQVTPEELSLISTFLMYKKKNETAKK